MNVVLCLLSDQHVPNLLSVHHYRPDHTEKASLHAKCVVVDRSTALVTSANFTDAAQWKNIEAGVEIRHRPTVERLADYFGSLIASRILEPFYPPSPAVIRA